MNNPMTDLPETKLRALRAAPRSTASDKAHGALVLDMVNRQNRQRLDRGVAQSWKKRSDEQVRIAYEAAMRGEDTPLVHDIYVPQQRYGRR